MSQDVERITSTLARDLRMELEREAVRRRIGLTEVIRLLLEEEMDRVTNPDKRAVTITAKIFRRLISAAIAAEQILGARMAASGRGEAAAETSIRGPRRRLLECST